MTLYTSSSCCASLEKIIGFQLDEVDLEDILIPNIGYLIKTIHHIDRVQRMLDRFMIVDSDYVRLWMMVFAMQLIYSSRCDISTIL